MSEVLLPYDAPQGGLGTGFRDMGVEWLELTQLLNQGNQLCSGGKPDTPKPKP